MSLRADVDRGLEIREQMEKLKAELKDIEMRLTMAGLQHAHEHEDLKDAEREGKRWPARGTNKIVPIIFTADKLIGSFKANSALHQTIRTMARGELGKFYLPATTYENVFDNGKKFRIAANEILGGNAPAFITACVAKDKHGIPKSDIKILWDDYEIST